MRQVVEEAREWRPATVARPEQRLLIPAPEAAGAPRFREKELVE
jgi:hypothetical protein